MLRPFKLKFDPLHRIQSFVNHLTLDILCKPHVSPIFSSNLIFPKYRDLINEVNENYILNPISDAFLICKTLSKNQLKVLKRAVHNNNRIRELCNGEIQPVLYSEIESISKDLAKNIKAFCYHLYDDCLTKKVFYDTYGKVADYYKLLVGKSYTCRVCGINSVLTKYHSKRKAFDHFFPRADFPFSSINFKNLFPLCDTCNETYKNSKNPIENEAGERTKAFYPFRRDTPDIEIKLNFTSAYSDSITPDDIEIDLFCNGFEEQVESWDRIFGIKENYLATCCSDEMYVYYNEQYLNSYIRQFTFEEYIDLLNKNKYYDMNLLKIAFLKAV